MSASFWIGLLAGAVILLAGFPLVLRLAAGLFRHAGATADTSGPAVPSTSQAAYDPVERP